ncbi:MAG: PEP-CTERM sorting domain-containing protein [Cyanobacteriota bacterium]|nr:PEP-CTERM sorting domain-containing protein [Cyanobacteriota bacterium]
MATVSIASIFSAIATEPAQATNVESWTIDYFDDSGELVGEGGFSYNLDTESFIETFIGETTEPEGFFVQAEVSFSAEVLGETWSVPGKTWWADPTGGLPGQQIFRRSPRPSISSGSWLFGDPFFGIEQLWMSSMEMISETVWEGSWSLSVAEDSTGPGFFGSGTWVATLETPTESVPEPATLFGLIAVFGFGLLTPRKQR